MFMLVSWFGLTLPLLNAADWFQIGRAVQQECRDRKSGSAGMPRPISYAVFCLKKKNAGYGLLVMLACVRVRSSADRERASRLSVARDISLIGFALYVFGPDARWS